MKRFQRTFGLRKYSTGPKDEIDVFLNPHSWKNLPADRIFLLHKLRKDFLKDKYVPNDDERNAILSTISSLSAKSAPLEYSYQIDNFKERYMNNTPVNLRGRPPRRSNINVISKGSTPHDERRIDQLHRVCAYEMPLLSKYRQPYVPKRDTETPFTLSFESELGSVSQDSNRKVFLSCDLKNLNLNEKQARKFKILAGEKFNHHANTIKIATDRYKETMQNARWLVDTLNKLLDTAKDLSDDFADIPLDTRHMKQIKVRPQFPDSWKRPEEAPVKKHMVSRKIVEQVKQFHDTKYMSTFTL